jgi:hypothetical protein
MRSNHILSPCKNCGNRFWLDVDTVEDHLTCSGFKTSYTKWLFHGETNGSTQENLPKNLQTSVQSVYDKDDMDQLLLDGFGMYDRSAVGSDVEHGIEDSDDASSDEDIESYLKLVNDGGHQLYPGCKIFTKLQFIVRLLNIKNIKGLTISTFEDVLTLFREALPEGHSLPKKYYRCRQYISVVGLRYDSYDTCLNDYIIFRGEHVNANHCSMCKVSRWKTERSVLGGKRISRVARKVIRHFPLKKTVQRMFLSTKTSELMSWHEDKRTKDGVLRHPADSSAWKILDCKFKRLRQDPRNIRFGMAIDGFNPFRNMNVSYSI